LRKIEPEAPKPEELAPVEDVVINLPNQKGAAAASNIKKDPTPPAPYRYCMPAHAEYLPPKATARNNEIFNYYLIQLLNSFFNLIS
jgi:hypothetical protein